MSRINDLLRQLDTSHPELAKDLRLEVEALTDRRAFGLNFERHQPEAVELPGRQVRRGDKVHVLPERGTNPTKENERLWRVVGIDRSGDAPAATLEPLDPNAAGLPKVGPADSPTVPLDDLVVVAEFRDPIYPGLVSTGKIERGGDKPFHTVINAENYHALQTLLFTHRNQVDCIYIDPPYNTGNDGWIYNDQYVSSDDLYKHSKWLAFMERRLLLAKELLKPSGVIMVAIGDEEHHRLRLLMDQIFEPGNFLTSVTWQGRGKNDRKYTGGGIDYMVVFASSKETLTRLGTHWKELKPGGEEMVAVAEGALQQAAENGMTPDRAQQAAEKALRRWMKDNDGLLAGGIKQYNRVDVRGRVFRGGPIDWPGGGGPRYEVLHPETKLPVPIPKRGWGAIEKTFWRWHEDGELFWGPDESTSPQRLLLLEEKNTIVPLPSFTTDRDLASKYLEDALGEVRFPFPKNHEVISRWLSMTTAKDAVVVDFFGGSATTAEAVMRLNAMDGGVRRCIVITNNEVAEADAKEFRKSGYRRGDPVWEAKGVYEYVAKPRVETAATGLRPDGSVHSDGLDQNVEFFTLTYEAPLRVSTNREFAKIAPLLWMRAGSQGRRIDLLDVGWDVAGTYGVIADLDQSEPFRKAVAEAGDEVTMAFIVTDEDRLFTTLCRELPDHVEPVRLYEAYLRNFEIESGRGSL